MSIKTRGVTDLVDVLDNVGFARLRKVYEGQDEALDPLPCGVNETRHQTQKASTVPRKMVEMT